jgi:hypothetical protein
MGYRLCFVLATLLTVADVFFTSIRSTWADGGDVALFVLLTVHEVVVVAMGVTVFALFSNTIWFTAGLLGELGYTIKASFPLWVCRLFFVQMPAIYNRFISSAARGWDDGIYGFLFVADIVSCVAFAVAFFFTTCAMSEKRMYPPYHREWQEEALRQERLRRVTNSTGTGLGSQQQSVQQLGSMQGPHVLGSQQMRGGLS